MPQALFSRISVGVSLGAGLGAPGRLSPVRGLGHGRGGCARAHLLMICCSSCFTVSSRSCRRADVDMSGHAAIPVVMRVCARVCVCVFGRRFIRCLYSCARKPACAKPAWATREGTAADAWGTPDLISAVDDQDDGLRVGIICSPRWPQVLLPAQVPNLRARVRGRD